jgi:hypothetical protein
LLASDVAIAVDHDINRIDLRVVHRGQIRVFCEHDWNRAWMVGKILLHSLIRFQHVDGQDDQIFALEFLRDVVYELCFFLAILAPGGPELEQDYLSLDRLVVELLAGRSLGTEAWSGLAGFVARLRESRTH